MWWTIFCILVVPLIVSGIYMSVLFVWLIYQTFSKKKKKAIDCYPKVTVLVPHYNENSEFLLQSLEAMENQDYPEQISIVLADDGSTNDIQTPLKNWLNSDRKQNYISIQYKENNGSKGKNMDATLPHVPEDTEVLIVVDSDTFLESQSVRKVVERMWQDEKCAAVCGFIIPANERNTIWQKLQYFEHIGIYPVVKSAQDVFGVVGIMAGAFVAHRMSVVRDIGGWGEWIVEDIAWTWKALASGYSTGYAPDAVAHTYNPTNRHCLFKQRRRWARGRVEAYKAAVKASPWRATFLGPFFFLYLLSLLPPTLFALPILAIVFQQWWVFALIAYSGALSISTFQLYQHHLPETLQKGLSDILRSTYYNSLFTLFLWRPNILGFYDEVFGKTKTWLTRGETP